jgi:hypothetical protein
VRPDTAADLTLFVNTIKLAQIASAIVKKLFNPSARKKPYNEIQDVITRLDGDLRLWQTESGIDEEEKLSSGQDPSPSPVRTAMRLELKLCFHCSLCALHSTSCRPWELGSSEAPEYLAYVQDRWRTITEASRTIITSCQPYQLSAATPMR